MPLMSALVFTYLALRPIKRVPQDSQRSKEAGVFATRSSVSRLLNSQPPYAGIELGV